MHLKNYFHIVTGGMGFIGINLCKNILSAGGHVFCIDRVDKKEWRHKFISLPFNFYQADLTNNIENLIKKISSINENDLPIIIWHLAANSDISAGTENINVDLNDTFKSTLNSIEIAKKLGAKKFLFSSSSAVYGSWQPEEGGYTENDMTQPISHYGAMKLASEAAISCAVEQGLFKAIVFRFPNVIGAPSTHGAIHDFFYKLSVSPNKLQVLGNGEQSKPYLHVSDLLSAMLFIFSNSNDDLCVINIANANSIVYVKHIAKMVRNAVNKNAQIKYENKSQGWIGDVSTVRLNTKKLESLGWSAKLSGEEAVDLTIEEIISGNMP